jgi:hypothetical protein
MQKKKKYLGWLQKKLKKQAVGRQYGKTNRGNGDSSRRRKQPAIPSGYSLHRSIRTLKYEAFVQIMIEDELRHLVISGNPPVDELVSAWNAIATEYSEAIRSAKSQSIFECYKKIILLQARIQIVDSAILLLTERYDEEVAWILFNMGYPLIVPHNDRAAYLKNVERVRTEAKTLVVILTQYVNEYKMLSPDGPEIKKDYQSYLDELAVLSKYQGYALRMTDITVSEYCSIVNSFIAYYELQKKNNGRATIR